jgi:hypothetical protein
MLLFMSTAASLALALGPLFLGYIIGWASPRIRKQVRTRRARIFWRPFAELGHLQVIGGGHRGDYLDSWEASGLAGIGDVKAIIELQDIFSQNGLGRLPVTFSTSPDLALIKDVDLILIGGPDANWVTLEMASKLPGRFRFGDAKRHIVSITDQVTGHYYPSVPVDNVIYQDAGVIKMMPNPLYPNNRLLIIAGAFGYGTLAGVKLIREESILRHPVISNNRFFECLFRVKIVADEPLPAEILEVQPFAAK